MNHRHKLMFDSAFDVAAVFPSKVFVNLVANARWWPGVGEADPAERWHMDVPAGYAAMDGGD